MTFTILVMVALLWSATMSVNHIDAMPGQNDMVVSMSDSCCPDQGGDHEHKAPHDCCTAHCMTMKPSNPDMATSQIERPALPVHFVYAGDIVPNQFLQGLFRPPRTLA